MEGLFSFLVFGVFFYLMMRLGCGAHMVHGSHGEHGEHATGSKHVDPVCDMDVDPNQGYGKMYEGHLYRFCSRNCLDKFDADPSSYVNKSEVTT